MDYNHDTDPKMDKDLTDLMHRQHRENVEAGLVICQRCGPAMRSCPCGNRQPRSEMQELRDAKGELVEVVCLTCALEMSCPYQVA